MNEDAVLQAPSGFALRQFHLFKDLPAERIDEIAKMFSWSSVEAGTTLMSGTVGHGDMVLVVSGTVQISAYVGDGKEVAIWSKGAGDLFGCPDSARRSGAYMEAVAQTSAVVARQTRETFLDLIRTEPALAEQVVLRLLSRTFTLVERVVDLSTLAVGQRLEVELLRLAGQGNAAESHPGAPVDGTSLQLPVVRHAELASRIGTNREQVTREINRLVREGVLSKDGKRLVIADARQLQRRVDTSRGR